MEAGSDANEVRPALLLDNVVKTYGPIRAVDGVSLNAEPGEFIALLGPNGAGKTTLFQLLSGLFAADSGRIEVMGHDMSRDPVPALARLGIVFQQPTLDLELSVTANLLFHAGLHGIPRAVAEAPHREGAWPARARRARPRQDRAAFRRQPPPGRARAGAAARAAAAADGRGDRRPRSAEPQRSPQAHSVACAAERSVAVLWATHLCDEVGDADRVIVLHRGKVLADTTPAQLVATAGAATIEEAFLSMTGRP